MSRALRGWALGILVALLSAVFGLNMAGGAQGSANAGPGRLLWVLEDAPLDFNNPFRALITKIDAVQGVPLLSFEQGYWGLYAPSLAVDGERHIVWALGGTELKAFDFAGTLLRTVVLPAYGRDLAVNPTDGSLWVALFTPSDPMTYRLEHRDAQGQLLMGLSSTTLTYEDLALDSPRGRAWVARTDGFRNIGQVEAYDETGRVVLTLPGSLKACALEADSDTGQLWVRLVDKVQRYSAAGTLELDVLAPASDWSRPGDCGLKRDGDGGVWIQSNTSLYRLSGTGAIIAAIDPWPGSTDPYLPVTVHAVAADQTDQSVWVATAVYDWGFGAFYKPVDLWHVSATGQVLSQIRLRDVNTDGGTPYGSVYHLVLSTVPAPPSLTFMTPGNSSVLRTGTPLIEVAYTPGDATVDPATLAFTENGQPLPVTCTHSTTGSSCTPNTPLAEGAHTISATVADVDGRRSAPAEVTFTVDTVAPVVTLTTPPDGLVTNQATQVVEGEVSEAATLTVKRNGEAVESFAVPSAAAFATSPVSLTEGSNLLEVLALDAAGNQGAASRTIALDTVAPVAVVAGQVVVGDVTGGQVTVGGVAGSVEPGVVVTIVNLRTGASVAVPANGDGSFAAALAAAPGDQLVVTSTDAAGNTSAATGVLVGPPRSPFVDALWVAQSQGLLRVGALDGAVLLEVGEPAGVRAVAVDDVASLAWAYRPGTLLAYDFTGALVRSVALALPPDYTDATPVRLVAVPGTGVWLSVGATVWRVDAQGLVRLTATLAEPALALAWDAGLARLWVGTSAALTAYRQTRDLPPRLEPVLTVDLSGQGPVEDLVVEASSGWVWAALPAGVRAYDATGTATADVPLLGGATRLSRDGVGGLWVVGPAALLALDGSGQVRVRLEPWPGAGPLVAGAGLARDGAAWVSSATTLTRVSAAGAVERAVALRAPLEARALSAYADLVAPALAISAPTTGATLATNTPTLEVTYSDVGSGIDPASLAVTVNGAAATVSCTPGSGGATCTLAAPLPEGAVALSATIRDRAGNASPPAEATVMVDTVPPAVTVAAPPDGAITNVAQQLIEGTVSEPVTLTLRLNGETVQSTPAPGGAFSVGPVVLVEGSNRLDLLALDGAGHQTTVTRTVTLDTIAPASVDPARLVLGDLTDGQVTVGGSAGSVEPGALVTVTNARTGQTVTITAAGDGSFSVAIAAAVGDQVAVVVRDAAGNASGAVTAEVVSPPSDVPPPDPSTVASAVDPTVATDFAAATAFLYTGPSPIQTGVASTTIEPERVAVLRGAVGTREGTPLSDVVITVAGHPEFGRTLSRADGRFDLAVNGGGPLVVRYEKGGYLPAQRQVEVPWREFAWLPDVVLVPPDPQVTLVQFTADAPAQAARGSVVSDADGQRQATVLVPAATTAVLEFPDGTTRPVTSLAVRATEYTVGAAGPAAMPAELPPTSGYTYAVELSGDEALAAGATAIRFSTPLVTYVENFLDVPVGGAVPAGYYDRARAAWIPSANGRVVRILSLTNGLADLDLDGSGVPADAAALAALGVTEPERQQLAGLYAAGQSLWRVPVPHFTPWDYNWPYGPPAGATGPEQPAAETDQTEDSAECTRCPASIIEAENQVLGEAIPITGTPFALHYRSDRVPGRKAANTYTIPLSGATLPPGLRRIDLDLQVAGRSFRQSFPAEPNQTTTFTWDVRDAYGRQLQGKQPITIRIGYVYPAVYQEPATFAASFGAVSGQPMSAARSRGEITIWQEQRGTITAVPTWYAKGQGLGGWTLGVHHAYDPVGQVLHLGTGEQRSARGLGQVIDTAAGTGVQGSAGDGGQAEDAELGEPRDVVVAADGSVYLAEWWGNRVRRIGPDGLITTVAGTGVAGFSGDGGPATAAQLDRPSSLALGPDGTLYIGDYFNWRIRRVAPDGIITTIAGTGLQDGPLNEGGLASETVVGPHSLAVGPDGSLFVADGLGRVRRIGLDGRITTVAGTGDLGFSGDGGPARAARLNGATGVDVGPDGSLYIADGGNHRVRRVGPDGIITTVAGGGGANDGGDGGRAVDAQVALPHGVAVGREGTLYIAQASTHRVRRVTPSGVITSIAGTGTAGYGGDRGPAVSAHLAWPYNVGVHPDGRLFIADTVNHRIRRLQSPLPAFALEELAIPSADGQALYRFSSTGRHLSTLDTRTGARRYQFRYDPAGRLVEVEDRDGLVTRVVRGAAGGPTAIAAPGGQETLLTLDANGYLETVTNPANETVRLLTAADGLLRTLTDARGHVYAFQYDGFGRLTREEDPATGFSAFAHSPSAEGHTVTRTTAEGRTSTFRVDRLGTGDRRFTTVDPSGLQGERRLGVDGSQVVTRPDGTTSSAVLGPDARFGMQAPLAATRTIRLPSGLESVVTQSRAAVLDDPADPLSLRSQTDTLTVNGRLFLRTFEAATRTLTSRTPAGRETVTTLDALGRVVEVRAPGVAPVGLAYDEQGRLATVTEGTAPDVRVTTLSYDAQHRLTGLVDAEGRPVAFDYDLADRVTRQVLPDLREIGLGYDANGNVTAVTPPGRPAHGFAYTPVDLEERYDPPPLASGPTPTAYAYNTDRQPTGVTRPDAQAVSFGYDGGGRLATLTQPRGVTTLAYHPTRGTLERLTAPDGGTLTYTHDGPLLTSVTWGTGPVTGTVAWTYDADFRVATEAVNGAAVSYAYDPDGLVTQAGALALTRDAQTGFLTGTSLGAITDSRGYSPFGELASYTAQVSGSPVFSVQYQRDKLGRIMEKTETVEGVTTVHGYQYDLAGRLEVVTRDGVEVARYSYDLNGNRLSATRNGVTETAEYDAQDRLLRYGDATYTYTANGELRTKTDASGTTTYYYDPVGNLLRVDLPDGTAIEYVIDGQNRRVGKKVNGQLVQGWLYRDDLKPVAELDGTGQVVAQFVYGASALVPDYVIKDGRVYRTIRDHLGSGRLTVDAATGVVVQRLDYDEFGRVILDTNPGFQPFGFVGGLYDLHTRFTRFGARDYDAETGRWTAKDPIGFAGRSTNLFSYTLNDPLNFVDADGRELVGAIVGLIAGGVSGAMSAALTGGDTFDIIMGAVVGGAFGAAIGALDLTGGALTVQLTVGLIGAEAGFVGSVMSQLSSNVWHDRPLDCISWSAVVGGTLAGAMGGVMGAGVALSAVELGATTAGAHVTGGLAGATYEVLVGGLVYEISNP